ncbi:hypothetical protein COCVIDRAFT_24092 [Bipolaris victoriae FI3]|uniref:Uncharacterized protein n=1 Tax=Bipolaris victoriae (strain FI3) TaxID=930091 RepID=W7EPU3_BIPV3|nr:hypothetical protein COCVIDRAFT_24092 [Bipolaris victoriae FI3]
MSRRATPTDELFPAYPPVVALTKAAQPTFFQREMTESTAKKCHSSTKDLPVPKTKVQPKLRDIPTSDLYFSDHPLSNYIVQQVRDKTFDGTNHRDLPPNEVDVLALNEIAVSEGEGFFFFLPNRSSWSRQTYEPRSRGPTAENMRYHESFSVIVISLTSI